MKFATTQARSTTYSKKKSSIVHCATIESMGKRQKTTEHHICCSSRGGSEHEDNKIDLPEKEHDALHVIGANNLPHEIIFHLLSISRTALNDDFVRRMCELLSEPLQNIYQQHCFHRISKEKSKVEKKVKDLIR